MFYVALLGRLSYTGFASPFTAHLDAAKWAEFVGVRRFQVPCKWTDLNVGCLEKDHLLYRLTRVVRFRLSFLISSCAPCGNIPTRVGEPTPP